MKKILVLLIATALLLSGCGSVSVEDANKAESNQQNQADYILNSDTEVITEVDLSKLNDVEIEYALQEIYARHGKIFSDSNYEKYFCSRDWYEPNPSFSAGDLTVLESENVSYIQKYMDEHNVGKTEESKTKDTQEKTSTTVTQQPTVIVVHDEDYYYKHYTGDNSYIIPDSNTRKLTQSELSGFNTNTLALIRNEIYARHGYVFQKQKYKDYFGSKQWYVPNSNFDASWLNSIEKYNIELIKSME